MQRDKRDIHTEKLDLLGKILRFDIADVRALHVHNAFVCAQTPCKLSIADIHRINLDGTVLQHAIRKAAGRCSNVHADLAIGCKRETLHSFFQLQAAAADITDVVRAHGSVSDHAEQDIGPIESSQ